MYGAKKVQSYTSKTVWSKKDPFINLFTNICDVYQVNKSTSGNMKVALEGIFKTHSFICLTSSIKFRGHAIFSIIRLRTLEGY